MDVNTLIGWLALMYNLFVVLANRFEYKMGVFTPMKMVLCPPTVDINCVCTNIQGLLKNMIKISEKVIEKAQNNACIL